MSVIIVLAVIAYLIHNAFYPSEEDRLFKRILANDIWISAIRYDTTSIESIYFLQGVGNLIKFDTNGLINTVSECKIIISKDSITLMGGKMYSGEYWLRANKIKAEYLSLGYPSHSPPDFTYKIIGNNSIIRERVTFELINDTLICGEEKLIRAEKIKKPVRDLLNIHPVNK